MLVSKSDLKDAAMTSSGRSVQRKDLRMSGCEKGMRTRDDTS